VTKEDAIRKYHLRRIRAQEMAWLHDPARCQDEKRIELLTLIRDTHRLVTEGGTPACACCGFEAPWHKLYKCFHCDLWYCHNCSRSHFGARPGFGG